MKNHKKMLVVSFILSIIGIISLFNFEAMAYWGEDTRVWFWLGAIFTYLIVFSSFLFIYLSNKNEKMNTAKLVVQLIIGSLSVFVLVGTTIVVYIWNFKDFSF